MPRPRPCDKRVTWQPSHVSKPITPKPAAAPPDPRNRVTFAPDGEFLGFAPHEKEKPE